ncbi:MAG: nucleotide-sugar transporter-domain-containing protein [Benniella sp.]|nr:MAG: nucleotide-sugar transporter-domain-containing protein [Benniella sp.]
MPAPTYVVLSNLKILTTGLFSYLFLKRLLRPMQWVSLGILFLSTAVSQVDLDKGLSLSISLQAFLWMILFCSLSAAASVFSEYVMQERFANESIHLQNMKLYMFGILFNGITYFAMPPTTRHDDDQNVSDNGDAASFFSDMGLIHLFIILAYASLGLVTSAIIKFSGSITKVYASSMSMFFAALVSWLLLNDQLTVLFFVGCLGCCLALHLYYRAPASSTTASSPSTPSEDNDDDDESAQRRASMAFSSSSTLVEVPMSQVKAHSSLLEAVKVVDRNEYAPLETR